MAGYICNLSENVTREHVRYQNRYGLAIAGDLYTAKGMNREEKHPALIVGAPTAASRSRAPRSTPMSWRNVASWC